MPLGGETIGTAYIRILADGSGLDDSIKREFDNADPAIAGAGRHHGKVYTEAWDKEMESRVRRNELQQGITNALAKGDFLNKKFFGGQPWQQFKTRMDKEFGEAGKRAAYNLEQDLGQGLTFEGLRGRLENVTAEVARATRDIMRDEQAAARDTSKVFQTNEQHLRRIRALYSTYARDVERFTRGERISASRGDLTKGLSDLRRLMEKAGGSTQAFRDDIDNLERRVRFANPTLNRARFEVNRFADGVSRGFGRGSRNNFVNFMGVLVGNFLRLPNLFIGALDKLSDFSQFIGGRFTKTLENTESTFAGVASATGAAALALTAGLAAVAVAAAGLTLAIGPLIAIMSGLLGIVIALASSLSFALVGAIGALVGTLAPAAAGVAVLALAFLGLNKAQKAVLKNDMRPIVAGFHELQRQARGPIFDFLTRQAKNFGGVLRGLGPLVQGVSKAIANIGDYFLHALHSVGFLQFQAAMTRFLPHAVESLGKSFGNVIGGVAGIFRALIPLTQTFLGWLRKVTGEFADWANSDPGQSGIQSFFRKAADSAQSLWHLLGAIGRLITTLFFSGRKTGNSIIDDLANAIDHFNEFLKKNPDSLQKFFSNAKSIAHDLGHIVKGLGQIANALDNPDTRKEAHALFFGIQALLGPTALGFLLVSDGINACVTQIRNLVNALKGIDLGFFGKMFSTMGNAIKDFVFGTSHPIEQIKREFTGLVNFFKGLPGKISGAFRGIPKGFRSWGVRAVGLLLNPFHGIAFKISQKLVGVGPQIGKHLKSLGPIASRAVRDFVSKFLGIAGKIIGKFTSVPAGIRKIVSKLSGIAASAVSATVRRFVGIAGKIAKNFAPTPSNVKSKLQAILGVAQSIVSGAVNKFNGVAGKIAGKFSGVASAIGSRLRGAVAAAAGVAAGIVSAFAGLAGRIVNAIGSITIHPHIDWPSLHIPGTAAGGMFVGLPGVGVIRQIGEAGPEAVVPLNRPLSQVDPAVRFLSAIAQGKVPALAHGGVAGGGKTVEMNNWTIVSPNTNTVAVAQEVANRAVAQMY